MCAPGIRGVDAWLEYRRPDSRLRPHRPALVKPDDIRGGAKNTSSRKKDDAELLPVYFTTCWSVFEMPFAEFSSAFKQIVIGPIFDNLYFTGTAYVDVSSPSCLFPFFWSIHICVILFVCLGDQFNEHNAFLVAFRVLAFNTFVIITQKINLIWHRLIDYGVVTTYVE